MKAIILAAGQGKRMRPLTYEKPKPLLEVQSKPLLEHVVACLPDEVDELIFVVGYLGQQIVDYCGKEFLGRKIKYVWQAENLGTFHALKICRPHIKKNERFFVLCADDVHGQEGIERCLCHKRALVVEEREDPRRFGVIEVDEKSRIKRIVEKSKNPVSNLVSTGAMLIDDSVFNYNVSRSASGEYYLSEAVSEMAKEYDIFAVKSSFWLPVGYPDDLKKAGLFLQNKKPVNS